MSHGWFKIWRKIENCNSWSRGVEYRGLMLTILQNANWKPGFFMGDEIMPGQLPTSAENLGKDLKLTRAKTQRMLKKLEQDGFITVKNVSNRYTLINIINWGTYQQDNAVGEQLLSNQRATVEQQVSTIEEGKKERMEKDILSYIISDNSDFCQKFIDHIKNTKGPRAPSGSGLLEKSTDTVEKLIRIDGFDLDYIKRAIWFAINDTFWSDNVLSLAGLRKKNDNLTKFQKIANSFEKSKKKINGKGDRSEQNKQACYDFIHGGENE